MKYKPFPSDINLYFVTSVITKHKSIFFDDDLAMLPLNALNFYAEKKLWRLFNYCLMPNHLHALLQILCPQTTIQKQMGEVHKFSGHKIIELLKQRKDIALLQYFERRAYRKNDRKYLVWEDAIAKPILTEEYLTEVIEYIHNNPLKENWRLVENRADYRYSSACFYDRGEYSVIPVVDIRDHWHTIGDI